MAGSVSEAYAGGQSIPQVAEAFGLPRSRVRRLLLLAGVALRSRTEGIRLASDRLGVSVPRPKSEAHRAKISAAARARADTNAKGVSVKPNGYVEFTRGAHKGRSVHVVTMEARLGRPLLPDEVVHHVDGNRANNEINNLALLTRSAHARLHRREQRLAKGAPQ